MSFFDFFFPEQAQATHLRTLARKSHFDRRRASRQSTSLSALEKRVEELEGDLGTVSLLLGSLMAQLEENGHLDRSDLRELIEEFDAADGKVDGRLDINVLRDLTTRTDP